MIRYESYTRATGEEVRYEIEDVVGSCCITKSIDGDVSWSTRYRVGDVRYVIDADIEDDDAISRALSMGPMRKAAT